MTTNITLGVTDCSKYQLYHDWIAAAIPGIHIIQLSSNQPFSTVQQCHGIILTGGEDVHPRFYNQPEYLLYCYPDDISEERDEFEMKILTWTEQQGIPVLGICRGLQVANVFFGGTLIPDIPTWGKFSHAKLHDGRDKYHPVIIDPSSWMYSILRTDTGIINSNHHQSADKVGNGLVASVCSPEGVIEAIERKDPAGRPFLCLVQWHPERLKDQESPFVKNIVHAFATALRNL